MMVFMISVRFIQYMLTEWNYAQRMFLIPNIYFGKSFIFCLTQIINIVIVRDIILPVYTGSMSHVPLSPESL